MQRNRFFKLIKSLFLVVTIFCLLAGCPAKTASDNEQPDPPEKPASPLVAKPLPEGAKADRVVVLKSERKLRLYSGETLLKEYRIALGENPVGHKQCQGDLRTPEGEYLLDYRNPGSKYYKAIHISYPNDKDRKKAEELGCDPGGDIMIHGLPSDWSILGPVHHITDWTLGCIAVTNAEIDEIWGAVRNGTPIRIEP